MEIGNHFDWLIVNIDNEYVHLRVKVKNLNGHYIKSQRTLFFTETVNESLNESRVRVVDERVSIHFPKTLIL